MPARGWAIDGRRGAELDPDAELRLDEFHLGGALALGEFAPVGGDDADAESFVARASDGATGEERERLRPVDDAARGVGRLGGSIDAAVPVLLEQLGDRAAEVGARGGFTGLLRFDPPEVRIVDVADARRPVHQLAHVAEIADQRHPVARPVVAAVPQAANDARGETGEREQVGRLRGRDLDRVFRVGPADRLDRDPVGAVDHEPAARPAHPIRLQEEADHSVDPEMLDVLTGEHHVDRLVRDAGHRTRRLGDPRHVVGQLVRLRRIELDADVVGERSGAFVEPVEVPAAGAARRQQHPAVDRQPPQLDRAEFVEAHVEVREDGVDPGVGGRTAVLRDLSRDAPFDLVGVLGQVR